MKYDKEHKESLAKYPELEVISYNKKNLERELQNESDSIVDSKIRLNGKRKKFDEN